VFANPVAPPAVLPSRDVLRFLRLISSPASRREAHVPLSAVATLAGLSKFALYNYLWTGRVSEPTAERLTQIVRAFEADRLKSRRDGGRSRRNTNGWCTVAS
jgi:hypothetical protein